MWFESAGATGIPAEHRAAGHHDERDPAADHNSFAHNDNDHTRPAAGTPARAEAAAAPGTGAATGTAEE